MLVKHTYPPKCINKVVVQTKIKENFHAIDHQSYDHFFYDTIKISLVQAHQSYKHILIPQFII